MADSVCCAYGGVGCSRLGFHIHPDQEEQISAWERAHRNGIEGNPVEKPIEHVNHPNHYGGDTTYETIKVLAAWGLGFCLGNAVKYISRAGKKDPSKLVEDLKKARWYLDAAITRLEAGQPLF